MAKVKAEEKPEVSGPDGEGWQDAGLGDLPPYTHLDVGDVMIGRLDNVRSTEQTEGKGKRAIVKIKTNLEIVVSKDGQFARGSVKKKTYKRVQVNAGEKIAFAIGGNLSTLLADAVAKVTGQVLAGDDDVDAKFLAPLKGKELRIERFSDGEIAKGQWKGNAVKRFGLKFRD